MQGSLSTSNRLIRSKRVIHNFPVEILEPVIVDYLFSATSALCSYNRLMSLRIFHPVQCCLPFPAKLTNAKKILAFSLNYHLLVCLFLPYMLFSAKFFFEGSVGKLVLKISFHFIFLFFCQRCS